MQILVLGNAQDLHAAHILKALTAVGCNAKYLDTSLFPQRLALSWYAQSQQGELTLADGSRLDFDAIHSVFWRTLYPVKIPSIGDSYQVAYNDTMSTLRTFMQGTSTRWVNSWRAYQFHREKPLQLNKVHQLGVTIPGTLITNDPQAVMEFFHSYPQVIFKPVYGGAYAHLLSPSYLEPERLRKVLQVSPVTLQEYIQGTNIRSYVIGEAVYSAEIRSDSLDFRLDSQAKLLPRKLPDYVIKQCLEIAQALWLEWTAIDWRLTPEGEYVFLEANFSPMFVHFERQTNFPLTQSLVNLLMSN